MLSDCRRPNGHSDLAPELRWCGRLGWSVDVDSPLALESTFGRNLPVGDSNFKLVKLILQWDVNCGELAILPDA